MKEITISVTVVTALLALSCGEEEGITRPPFAYFPVDVVENVEMSFNVRDIDLLKECLSRDFVFYFDPDDVGKNPPGSEYIIPESWSYTEFWSAVKNMFQKAYRVSLYISTSRIRAPGENEVTYKAQNVRISLLVMVDENNGFIADGGYCDFAFQVYYNETKEKLWRLTGWWDFTNEYFDRAPALTPTSLGMILAAYK